jgi:methyltransferase family protein
VWRRSDNAFGDHTMNDLEKYFTQNTGNLIHKWMHYFEIYDRHFSRYRGTDVHLVEFGVNHGGSLQMWADYFGPRARIYGIDINPECQALAENAIDILIGSQDDRAFLRSVADKIPRVDILIDDGGHTMQQQTNTFEELFAHIDPHGVYLCEDLHTSYWERFGGGYANPKSFIEYTKNFIDALNAWHSEDSRRLEVSTFTRSVHSLHYYDSVLVIEKRPIEPPYHVQKGSPRVTEFVPARKPKPRFKLFG